MNSYNITMATHKPMWMCST